MEGASSNSHSRLCSICFEADFKYTCPLCFTKTCSLTCSRRHKLRSSCEGQKRPGTFKRKSDLQQPQQVAADFDFLNSIQRSLNRAADDERQLQATANKSLDIDIRKRCNARNIDIIPAPSYSPRGKRNKTYLQRCGSVDTIIWTVEWVLDDAVLTTIEMDENLSFETGFQNLVASSLPGRKSPWDASFNSNIKPSFYLRSVDSDVRPPKLMPLAPTDTLFTVLSNITILEYPTIQIVLPLPAHSNNELDMQTDIGPRDASDT